MGTLEKLFAEKLLKVKAIKLQPSNPFTWASGWKSPFYCDNRKTLSYPSLRNFVKVEISRLVLEKFGQVDAIAGVATGAIAQGALVAEELNLPFVYVRSSPKDHGLENLIEGELRPGMKVVVIEDLISTGGSSLKAVEAIRRDGCEVIGMIAFAELRKLSKYNNNCLTKQVVRTLFTECVFGNISVLPVLFVRMIDLNTHKTYEIYRLNIIVFSFFVLVVVCSTCIAYAAFEPSFLSVVLHLNDKYSARSIPA